jgi:hypothetical protein
VPRPVDDIQVSLIAAANDIGEHLVAHTCGVNTCADDHDRGGREDPRHRFGIRSSLANTDGAAEAPVKLQRQLDVYDIGSALFRHRQARIAEQMEHRGVSRKHLSYKPGDAIQGCQCAEVLKQKHADTTTVLSVVDEHGKFGDAGIVVESLERCNSHHLATDLRHQRAVVVSRRTRHALDVAAGVQFRN